MSDNYQYLLDTNMLSELLRAPSGAVAQKIRKIDTSTLCTSIVVACELRFGAEKKGSSKLAARVDAILSHIVVLPLDRDVDYYYAKIRDQLDKKGTPIGPNDLLIASHAVMLDLTLVTANVEEFLRVPNLVVENWLS